MAMTRAIVLMALCVVSTSVHAQTNSTGSDGKKRVYVPVRVHASRIRGSYSDGRLRMSPSIRGAISSDSLTMWLEKPEPKNWHPTPVRPATDGGPLSDASLPDNPHSAARTGPVSPSGMSTQSAATLTFSFDTIPFGTEGQTSGTFHIPPDPYVAVGPDQVVLVVNATIEWYSKTGSSQNRQSLESFFQPLSPVSGLFDPKVIFDQISSRYVLVALEKRDTSDGDTVNSSRILIAVSASSDPNGTWAFQALETMIDVNSIPHWADYPGLAVDANVIYLTANLFTFGSGTYGGSRLWVIKKTEGAAGLYTGGISPVSVFDPFVASGSGSLATTIQPAHVFLPAPTGTVGTWLVAYGGLSTSSSEFLHVIRVDDPTMTPSFTSTFVAVGDIDDTPLTLPDAPQSGTSTRIMTNNRRALNAVWRNNQLYGSTTIRPGPGMSDGGEATAFWFRVDATNPAAPALAESGTIGGEDIAVGTYTFFPSIAVNAAGDVAVGFSASGSGLFPGAYVSSRKNGEAAGSMGPAVTLRAGVDFYVRTFSSSNRWGDYSGSAVDPTDDASFWMFNEYALQRGIPLGGSTDDGVWGTAVGKFTMDPTPVVAATQAGISLIEGQESLIDLATIFSGGSGTIAYSSLSASDQHVTASVTGSQLTLSAIEAYASGVPVDSVAVTSTAVDAVGSTASSVLMVDVRPKLGDLDGSGSPSAYSAALALDEFLGLISLPAKQHTAADFDEDGDVDAHDAFLIWQASMPAG